MPEASFAAWGVVLKEPGRTVTERAAQRPKGGLFSSPVSKGPIYAITQTGHAYLHTYIRMRGHTDIQQSRVNDTTYLGVC